MRNTYTLELKDGKEKVKVELRLTIAGQLALKKKYKENTYPLLFEAIDDAEIFCFILGEALNWKGNENSITDGEELYDLIVDNGYQGIGKLGEILFSIATVSGLISESEKERLLKRADRVFDDALDELDETEESSEGNEKEKNVRRP